LFLFLVTHSISPYYILLFWSQDYICGDQNIDFALNHIYNMIVINHRHTQNITDWCRCQAQI